MFFHVLVPFCKGGQYMCTHFIKIWDGCAKKHERNMGESKNYERTRMDTKGHEWTKAGVNHEKHEIHEKHETV